MAKDHRCDLCGLPILEGENAMHGSPVVMAASPAGGSMVIHPGGDFHTFYVDAPFPLRVVAHIPEYVDVHVACLLAKVGEGHAIVCADAQSKLSEVRGK